MNMSGLKQRILTFLSSETVELAQDVKLEDGVVLVVEDLKEGSAIFIKSVEDGEDNVKLPIGDYKLEDGRSLVIEEEGIVKSIGENDSEEVKEDEPKEDELAEDVIEEVQEEVTEDVANPIEAMLEVISALELRIDALEESKVEMKEEVLEELTEEVSEEVRLSSEEVSTKTEDTEPVVHIPNDSKKKSSGFYLGKN